jgi:hypothetical protein
MVETCKTIVTFRYLTHECAGQDIGKEADERNRMSKKKRRRMNDDEENEEENNMTTNKRRWKRKERK